MVKKHLTRVCVDRDALFIDVIACADKSLVAQNAVIGLWAAACETALAFNRKIRPLRPSAASRSFLSGAGNGMV